MQLKLSSLLIILFLVFVSKTLHAEYYIDNIFTKNDKRLNISNTSEEISTLDLDIGFYNNLYGAPDNRYEKDGESNKGLVDFYKKNFDGLSLTINPFFFQENLLKNFAIRADYVVGSEKLDSNDYSYLYYRNYKIYLLYYFYKTVLLTLYGGYAIINNYNMSLYDFQNELPINIKSSAYGYMFGIDILLFLNTYVTVNYTNSVMHSLTYVNKDIKIEGISVGLKFKLPLIYKY